MNRHLISINDLTFEDVEKIFDLAKDVKHHPAGYRSMLQGRMFALVFEKPSTRTWVSFESGIYGLGGGTIYLGPQDIKLGVREEVRDVARVLERYLEGVVLRTFEHKTIEEFAKYFKKPVINGLSDFEHPCQALADYFTLCEKFPDDSNPKIAYIGDGNNVLNSLIRLAALLGTRLHFATPKNHGPSKAVMNEALELAEKTGGQIKAWQDPVKAVQGADAVYTDVWVSMGQEKKRKDKMSAFKNMQVNRKLMKHAKKNAMVMHCLPAHRGEEITNDVLEGKNSVVFDQAENRLHVQKAVLLHLMNRDND